MKKITLMLLVMLAFCWQSSAQYGCTSGVVITDGYTAAGITSPGNGGPEDWNSPNPSMINMCQNSSGNALNPSYFDDDVYLFTYTAGANDEEVSMTITSNTTWTGIGIFASCNGTALDDCMGSSGSSAGGTLTATATVAAGQTVYIGIGQWGTPNAVNFDVDMFSATPLVNAPNCDSVLSETTNVGIGGDISWSAATGAPTGYRLTVGTTMGGNDVADNVDAGSVTTYNVGALMEGTTYYVTIVPYNGNGDATGCTEQSFVTVTSPSNDECTDAEALTVNADLECGSVTSGTTVGATASAEDDTDTSGTPNNDVWFSFVATGSEHTVSLLNVTAVVGTSTDMGMAVYDATGGCAALVFEATSDPNSLSLTGLTGGTTYYVRVYGWGTTTTAQATFDICVGTPPMPPANDECSNAEALTVNADLECSVVTAGTTVSATASAEDDTDTSGTPNNDVWFSFVATGSEHTVSLLNVSAVVGTSTDMGMAVYDATGGCAALVFEATSDPNSLSLTGLTGGTTYYVRVYGWGTTTTAQATFDVCVGTPPAPPANDDIANAIAITVDENFCDGTNTNGTNVSASDSGEGAGSCFNAAADDDVWFTFTVPGTTASVDVSTDFTGGTLVDSEIAVYSGTSGSLVELACSQDEGTTVLSNGFSWNSLITDLAVTAGETYYVQVAGYNANTGTFCLDISTNQVLGIDDVQDETAFSYYPNPVKNTLTLNAQNTIESVIMYNMLGQEVLKAAPNNLDSELDMSNLESGAYFVRVTIANITSTVRVIKQ